MLKLDPDPTFPFSVALRTPQGEETLKLIGRHMTVDEHAAWWKAALKSFTDFQEVLKAHNAAVLKAVEEAAAAERPVPEQPEAPKPEKSALDEIMEVIVGWEDVDAEFGRESMRKLLANYHDLSASKICEAWSAALTQARREN